MGPARTFLGITRALIGIGSWIAPDRTARLFGIDPERSDRFITRLFGARELALAGALLAAPPSSLPAVAATGAAIDAVDARAGVSERRRGHHARQGTHQGPVGAGGVGARGPQGAREGTRNNA
jgi:hypothetical protein